MRTGKRSGRSLGISAVMLLLGVGSTIADAQEVWTGPDT
jgi:hypothetical protein